MSNPFASLMGNSPEPKLVAKAEGLDDRSSPADEAAQLSATLESIFQITLNPEFQSSSKCKYAIYLESPDNVQLNLENLDEVCIYCSYIDLASVPNRSRTVSVVRSER